MQTSQIPTTNHYETAYEQFEGSTLFHRLEEKYRVKPFYIRYKALRQTAIMSSYGVNIFSMATAFTSVFVFLNTLLQNSVVSCVLCVAFLAVLELFKRLTIPDFFKNILQFRKINWLKGLFVLLLMGISISLSYFGAKESIILFTPEVVLEDVESAKSNPQKRIATLENRLSDIRKTQSWQGKLTPKGQKSYNRVTEQIAQIEGDLLENANRLNRKNDELIVKHSEKTSTNAYIFGIMTLIFDFSLLFLLGFSEYYDYRSLAEFTNRKSQQGTSVKQDFPTDNSNVFSSSNAVATTNNGIDERILGLAIKNAKANLAAYDAKIRNNEGNEDTNNKGREKWWSELQQLEARLQLT
jgi:hypothetical protein